MTQTTLSISRFFEGGGTRFRLHPQSPVLEDFRETEIVWVSSPRGSLGPGPSDHRMYAVSPVDKTPYEPGELPPYRGPVHPAAHPGPDGHFDAIDPDSPAFLAAHMFGSVRRVLDIWEVYAGGPVPWHFGLTTRRLELVSKVAWKNAQFGTGFCECGEDTDDGGLMRPFALNFDIIAHEVGHGLIFSMAGIPPMDALSTEYLAFHEAASDLVAIVSALHFDSFVAHALNRSRGDLYVLNELNRIGELSGTRQIRTASNALRLDELAYRATPPNELTGHQVHELGQPFTGAVFDILVEFYLSRLVDRGLIDASEAEATRRLDTEAEFEAADRTGFHAAYDADPDGFAAALAEARDMLGLRLARSWHRLRPADLRFADAAAAFLAEDRAISGRRYEGLITACFAWRAILPRE